MSKRRAGGRLSKHAMRAAQPIVNPAPPAQVGGQYRPLSENDVKNIFETAVRLLAQLGMGEVPGRLSEDLCRAGAEIDGRGRHVFPRSLTEDAIASAAKQFILHGRDESQGNRLNIIFP